MRIAPKVKAPGHMLGRDASVAPPALRIARGIVFIILILTVALTYGGENFQIGNRGVPLVWALMLLASALTVPQGVQLLHRGFPILSMTWIAVVGGGVVRLSWDIWDHGVWALRDSVFFLSGVGLPIGLVFGWTHRSHHWPNLVTAPIALAIAHALTAPWRSLLLTVSPVSGVFKPVPLLGHSSTIYVSLAAAWSALLTLPKPLGARLLVALMAVLMATALTQMRLAYGSLPIALLLVLWLDPGSRARRLVAVRILLIAGAIGSLLLLSEQIRIPGRWGVFSPALLSSQLGTLAGREGPGAGSFRHRMQEYPEAIKRLLKLPPASILLGRGLGMELDLGGTGILARRLHLDPVETVYRLGLLGALWSGLVLMICWRVLKTVKVLLSREVRQEDRPVLAAVAAFLAMSIVASAFQPMFYWAYGAFPYFFFAGLILGIALRLRSEWDRAA